MKKTVFRHLLLVAYVMFIFSNSLTPAVQSSAESGFVLQYVHRALYAAGLKAPWLTEHVIRKSAHFAEYTLLGLLLFQSLNHMNIGRALRRQLHTLLIFFIPFVDETLQLFTEGRSGQISDVWLDMSGVLAGSILYLCICFLISGKAERKRNKAAGRQRRDAWIWKTKI